MADEARDSGWAISDGHGWVTTYRNDRLKREAQVCASHDGDPGCGIHKFCDDGNWVIADVAPWVAKEHVQAHARSRS